MKYRHGKKKKNGKVCVQAGLISYWAPGCTSLKVLGTIYSGAGGGRGQAETRANSTRWLFPPAHRPSHTPSWNGSLAWGWLPGHTWDARASQMHPGHTQRLVLTPEACTERPAERWGRGRTANSGVRRGPAGNANVWRHLNTGEEQPDTNANGREGSAQRPGDNGVGAPGGQGRAFSCPLPPGAVAREWKWAVACPGRPNRIPWYLRLP